MMKRRAVLLLTVVTVALIMVASPAWAADPIIVNRTGDGGDDDPGNGTCAVDTLPDGFESECTLRAAIEEANATTAADTINFDIPGEGPHTIITTGSSAPSITITQPVTINGYSESGASENSLPVGNNAVLLIRLDGEFANRRGLLIEAGASGSVVRGLSIIRYTTALSMSGADNNTIAGNFIGTDPGGTQEGLGSNNGVVIVDGAANNNLGGTSPGARNVISGNGDGVVINGTGSTGNNVMGNYIGTTKSGSGDLGNRDSGVLIGTPGNLVGDNDQSDGFTNAANIIAFNGDTTSEDGVSIFGDSATGNTILSNSIFSNAGLGIDLQSSTLGVTPNDGPGDPDTGSNNLQNFPLITSATTGRRATTIRGTLESTHNGTFIIQFFSNPKSTRDEGKKFIGQKIVSDTDGDGIVPFTFQPPQKVKAGLFVTSTATNDDTSEFSAPKKAL
jgi:CSLREA domain-containing protein